MSKSKENQPPASDERPPVSGAEFRFLRRYFRLSQANFGKISGHSNRQAVANLEKMEQIPAGVVLEFEKYIRQKYLSDEFGRARSLYKSKPPKEIEKIVAGQKSKAAKQKKKTKKNFKLY